MRRALSLALLAALAGCGGGGGDAVHLGVAGPMQQASGQSMLNAARMAAEEINAAGGIRGMRLELVVQDDRGADEGAIEAALALREDPRIVAVVGHVNSSATSAAAEIYNHPSRGVVELSPVSSSPRISLAGPWTFRVCPTDLQHGVSLADQAYAVLGARHAAVLYANDAYGRGVVESFGAAFQELGGTVVTRDPFIPATPTDEAARTLDPYLERALATGMDALVIGGQAEPGLGIVRAARRLGYGGPVLGADGLTGIRTAGPEAEGIYVSSAYLPDRPTPESEAFVRAYRERYGDLPDHRAAMSFDAVRLLARVIGEAGTDRQAVRDALAQVGRASPPFEGVSGTIAFDENGDLQRREVTVGVVRGGNLVSAESASR